MSFFQICVFSPHRRSVCLCFLTGPRLAACKADELRNPPVCHRKRDWTLGWGVDDRETGRTHRPAPFTQLFAQPCPNPTTLPPLPSASPFLIIHWPANISFPPLPLQSGPGARVTNARPGLAALFCPFSFFHCFSLSCVLCGPRPIPTCHGSTTRWGEELWGKSGKSVGHKGRRHAGGDGD